jgi:hypothetical protein
MADRVNAAMEGVELPAREPPLDGSFPHTARSKLPPRYHSILSTGELRKQRIDSTAILTARVASTALMTKAAFASYARGNAALVRHAAEGDGTKRTCGARFAPKARRSRRKTRLQPAVAASGFDPFK